MDWMAVVWVRWQYDGFDGYCVDWIDRRLDGMTVGWNGWL